MAPVKFTSIERRDVRSFSMNLQALTDSLCDISAIRAPESSERVSATNVAIRGEVADPRQQLTGIYPIRMMRPHKPAWSNRIHVNHGYSMDSLFNSLRSVQLDEFREY